MKFKILFLLLSFVSIFRLNDANSLAVTCSSTSIAVNHNLTCVATATFTCTQVTLSVNFGDGNSANMINNRNFKGIPVPTSEPSYLIDGPDYNYTILNSEFFEDDYVLAVEWYMFSGGSAIIYMIGYNTTALGSTVADYITLHGTAPDWVSWVQLWSGPAPAGYNRVNFSSPILITEGYVLGVNLPGNERIALNNQTAGFYTDFVSSQNDLLSPGTNAYANVITNSTELTKATGITTRNNKIKHAYSALATYTVTTSFTCGTTTYSNVQYINVIPNFVGINCVSTSVDITQSLVCNVTVMHNCLQGQVEVSYDDGSSKSVYNSSSTSSFNVMKTYSTTGSFPVLASLICDSISDVNAQQIVSVTDGRVNFPVFEQNE